MEAAAAAACMTSLSRCSLPRHTTVGVCRTATAGSHYEIQLTCMTGVTRRPESPEILPLLEAAQTRADGRKVPPAEARTPFKIIFEPTKEVQGLYAKQLAAEPEGDMRMALGSLPTGTVLYNVLLTATRAPDAERHLAGTITMTSTFVASKFGDENLFFQHMRHRDMAL